MGDVAEMMLEGILCECCGEYIGEPVGHPRECKSCCEAEGKVVPDGEDDALDVMDNDHVEQPGEDLKEKSDEEE